MAAETLGNPLYPGGAQCILRGRAIDHQQILQRQIAVQYKCVRCHCVVLGMYCTVVHVSVLFFVNRRVTRCQQLAPNPTLRCTVGALLLLIVNNLKTSAVFKQERGWRWWWLVMRKVLQRKVWKAFSKPPAAREGEMRMKFSSFSFFLLHSPFFSNDRTA